MLPSIGIGHQDFEKVRTENIFYIDKTDFIKEWWDAKDEVTLITRPRRFGKTLNMSMLNCFFSNRYENRGDLFENLKIWEDENDRRLQGKYPVIFLSFADIKETTFENAYLAVCEKLISLYSDYEMLNKDHFLNDREKDFFDRIAGTIHKVDAANALKNLSRFLSRYYGKKVIILLDEYDTPMQEAYVNGYWKEMSDFIRSLFNSTFKTNPYMERGMMTGITRVSKESIFSDLNNLKIITTTSTEYETAFGFTEEEVFHAMDLYGYSEKEKVRKWYDGFTFGKKKDIYNPWSVINYLDTGVLKTYWANTSSNSLVGKMIQEAEKEIKEDFFHLLSGGSITCSMEEEIIFEQLDDDMDAIWSLLLASGYLKIIDFEDGEYELALTNFEIRKMFEKMVKGWFKKAGAHYNDFIKALLDGNIKEMNYYMNKVALSTFSCFDTGNRPSQETEPERFYHGFVLGLLVELKDRYEVKSNRESGLGRYDVMLIPKEINAEDRKEDGILLEFKVMDSSEGEENLQDTVRKALEQMEEKRYEQELIDRGIAKERIRKYGFAFEGKRVLIGGEGEKINV